MESYSCTECRGCLGNKYPGNDGDVEGKFERLCPKCFRSRWEKIRKGNYWRKRIIEFLPMEKEFRAMEVAEKMYPDLVKSDTEGRTFNRGVGTTARLLRKLKGVQEVRHGVFYAHKEYF